MTNSHTPALIDSELVLKFHLGNQTVAYRPAARTETGAPWKVLNEDTSIGLTDPANLKVRLMAYDQAGDLIAEPAWTVSVSSRLAGGGWEPLLDRSASNFDYLTRQDTVGDIRRTYRLTIGLQGSNLLTTYVLDVKHHDAAAGDDDDHDILFDPDDDLKPPSEPIGASSSSIGNGLAAAS